MSLLGRVVSRLEAHHIPFALIGAAAMAAHGVSRSTGDIDFLTTDFRVLNRDMWSLDETVDIRRGDADDPLAGVVRASAAGETTVDVIVGRHAWQRDLLARATTAPIDDVRVPVVDAAGLVMLKLFAGGPQDAWDIQQLLAAADEQLVAAVDRSVDDLPKRAVELWRRLNLTRPAD